MKLLGLGDSLFDSIFSKFIKEEGKYYAVLENGKIYSLAEVEKLFN